MVIVGSAVEVLLNFRREGLEPGELYKYMRIRVIESMDPLEMQ